MSYASQNNKFETFIKLKFVWTFIFNPPTYPQLLFLNFKGKWTGVYKVHS